MYHNDVYLGWSYWRETGIKRNRLKTAAIALPTQTPGGNGRLKWNGGLCTRDVGLPVEIGHSIDSATVSPGIDPHL